MQPGKDGNDLAVALIASANAEDESIKDLRRAMQGQLVSEQTLKKSSSLPELRADEALLEPGLGRALQDVAQPGGFRRHHVRQAVPGGAQRSAVQRTLIELLQPRLSLSYLQDEDDEGDTTGDRCDIQKAASHTSSNLATGIVILKCCFGSAILIVPHGFKTAGLVGAPLCLIAVYIFLLSGMLKLIECRRAYGCHARIMDLGQALGSRGQAYVTVCVMLLCFGFNCIWCVTCAENLSMVFPDWSDTVRLWVWAPLVAPLALVRRLKFFTITNLIGVSLCSATCVYLTFFAGQELLKNGTKPVILFNTKSLNTFLWIGTCGYIFELICAVLPIYEAAADKEAMPRLLVGVTAAIMTVYILFGVLFYCAFGDATAELATLNLQKNSVAGNIIPVMFSFVGVASMPLNLFSIYQSYEPLFVWSESYRVRKCKKNVVRIAFAMATYGITWLGGQQLQNFLALVGGLLGANLSLAIPSAMHLAICKPTGLARMWDLVCMVAAIVIMACSTYQALATWK
mmetsp:Transcript_8429/g.21611  ORF Transcript_8429/g.21611 Transcript_8429/m.21611 type:complete len:514 (-) Transcript_8429:131-1672(-)